MVGRTTSGRRTGRGSDPPFGAGGRYGAGPSADPASEGIVTDAPSSRIGVLAILALGIVLPGSPLAVPSSLGARTGSAGAEPLPSHSTPMTVGKPDDRERSTSRKGAADADTLIEGRYEGTEGSRRYLLSVPAGPSPGEGHPLVLMLHGCTQDPRDVAAGTRMDARAAGKGWLVLYPEQPPEAHPQRCWNWYAPEHQSAESGEPALLVGLLDEVTGTRDVDPDRVFLAGISAGGAMASVLAAVHPDRFAAVAVHSGVPYRAAGGAREAMAAMQGGGPNVEELAQRLREALGERTPPPLLVMHGSEDQAVAPVNGRRLAAAWLRVAGRAGPPEGGAGSLLPAADRDEAHTGSGVHPWRLRAWESDGPRVELREVEGLGHAWSGGDPAGSYTDPEGPDATAWVVEFFERASGSAAGEAADPHPDDEGPARARAP